MTMCKGWGELKSPLEYDPLKGNSDGVSGKCKECIKSRVRENRRENLAQYKAYEKGRANLPHRVKARLDYAATDEGRKAQTRGNRAYRERNPVKYKAHNMVNNAVRDGKLFPLPCEICFNTHDLHAHHDDYAKPLNVRWLCSKHHREWHRDIGEAKNP